MSWNGAALAGQPAETEQPQAAPGEGRGLTALPSACLWGRNWGSIGALVGSPLQWCPAGCLGRQAAAHTLACSFFLTFLCYLFSNQSFHGV